MRVVIVGGGSAGWITAALLDAELNKGGRRQVEISLIESSKIGRIGVGEATVPTIKRTLMRIGVPERDFLEAANATFKQAIQFRNWREPGHVYYHPFDRIAAPQPDFLGLQWLASDRSTPFAMSVSAQPVLCDAGLSPKLPSSPEYQGVQSYAYHMDAEKFADYLLGVATARGVRHVTGDVRHVEMTPAGNITSVTTEDGARIEGDLFIDCTGFARLLIGQAMGVGFESYKDWLLCDRALAMPVSYDVRPMDEIPPYTTSTALSSGWVWDIGLRERRGVGYVYSSQFISDEDAEAELKAFEGPHSADLRVRRLAFESGRTATSWKGNCVAIGLSAGFLEPLESTGIFLIETGVDYLIELFPRLGRMELARDAYNREIATRYEECLDFINLHYCLSRRDTPFWREVARPERTTPRIREMLSLWEEKPPSRLDFTATLQLFAHVNYEYILYGMGWLPKSLEGRGNHSRPPNRDALHRFESESAKELKPHRDFLSEFIPLRR